MPPRDPALRPGTVLMKAGHLHDGCHSLGLSCSALQWLLPLVATHPLASLDSASSHKNCGDPRAFTPLLLSLAKERREESDMTK